MTPERWKRVKRILEEVLALPDASWAGHLETACQGDDSLRRDVESFLTTTSAELESFLEQAPVAAPRVPDGWLPPAADATGEALQTLGLADVAPYTAVAVTTRSTVYRVVVVAPLDREVLIEGGRRFPQATRGRVLGEGEISVGTALQLQVGSRRVVTTRVRSLAIVD